MIYLDDYRDVKITPNYDRPVMTADEEKQALSELSKTNIAYFCFMSAIGSIFAAVAYATRNYMLSTIGILWILVYYTLVLYISSKRKKRDGAVYLLVDKITMPDEDIGLTECIMIMYQPETDAYCKMETDYHIYRDAYVGDWIYVYMTDDNIYVIPEYPNRKWGERRKSHEENA